MQSRAGELPQGAQATSLTNDSEHAVGVQIRPRMQDWAKKIRIGVIEVMCIGAAEKEYTGV